MRDEAFNKNDIDGSFFREALSKIGHYRNVKHFVLAYDCIRFFVRENIILKKIYTAREYKADYFVCQMAHGDTDVMLGLSGNIEAMLYLAGCVAEEQFDVINEDAYDAMCEFVNLANGKYAAFLEEEGMDMDVVVPMCCENCQITANGNFCILTLLVNGKELDIISVVDLIPYMT
ncbi:MAG: hypothetical protein PUF12_12500 [Thermoflexaceae bacterium]|nr:hypothetical protein [Thermoflexaceae bacterium]